MKYQAICKEAVILLFAVLLGFLAIVTPVFLDPGMKRYDAPLSPLVATAIEGLHVPALIFLFIAGLIVGLFGKSAFWRIGLATMFAFPVVATIEIFMNPNHHNLWPIEFFIYGVLCIPGMLGALSASGLRRLYKRNAVQA